MHYSARMAVSDKVRQLAEGYAGLSEEERSEFVSLVSPDERARLIGVIQSLQSQSRSHEEDGDVFREAMDKVFRHHAPLLEKLSR